MLGCWFSTVRQSAGRSWGGWGQKFVPGCGSVNLPLGSHLSAELSRARPCSGDAQHAGPWVPWEQGSRPRRLPAPAVARKVQLLPLYLVAKTCWFMKCDLVFQPFAILKTAAN